ncbi:MAG: hypothetical protein Q7K35_03240 [bacterium]|nr:hypothetical protein [bacterium]
MITANAEMWCGAWTPKVKQVTLVNKGGKIFVDGIAAEAMEFNRIQLRFTMPNKDTVILFDGKTESDLSIEQMYKQLKR